MFSVSNIGMYAAAWASVLTHVRSRRSRDCLPRAILFVPAPHSCSMVFDFWMQCRIICQSLYCQKALGVAPASNTYHPEMGKLLVHQALQGLTFGLRFWVHPRHPTAHWGWRLGTFHKSGSSKTGRPLAFPSRRIDTWLGPHCSYQCKKCLYIM